MNYKITFLNRSVILVFLFFSKYSFANDGSFRVNGNQLIPINESVISVKKEILTIKRINNNQAEINVYYEFFNPNEYKEIEVGFEAYSPFGDVSTAPVDGRHPYIYKFSVLLNEKQTPFQVAIVGSDKYFRNGKFIVKKKADVLKEVEDGEEGVNFFYVYHFKAGFKNGINILKHNYVVDLSNSVFENYSLKYILTAAKRWANHQIDDFTLKIDMGEFQDISIENTFFKNASEWTFENKGKSAIKSKDTSEFFIRKGALTLHKTNFKPSGELEMHSFSYYYYRDPELDNFDSRKSILPYTIIQEEEIQKPANELSKKILKNLPFARRGYIFKSTEIQNYYNKQLWYMPDPSYVPELNLLTAEEKKWLSQL